MRRIFALGETVLDIIFKNNKPLKAIPGGSMLNTTVTLGRLHKPVSFITEFGDDYAGKIIMDFLRKNNVCTDYIYMYRDGHTILALAFLDENNNAGYNFYKIYPFKRFDFNFPDPAKDDMFLFGSFLSIDKEVRAKIVDFIFNLKERNVLIVYDPNFRVSYLKEMPSLLPLIKENIGFSDIVKGSDEDFSYIFGTEKPEEIYEIIYSLGCKNLIITRGSEGVVLKTEKLKKVYPVKKLEIKSTIGAGDSFNAGILYSLYFYNIKKEELPIMDKSIWDKIIENSICFASNVCQGYENYIDFNFAYRMQEK